MLAHKKGNKQGRVCRVHICMLDMKRMRESPCQGFYFPVKTVSLSVREPEGEVKV